MARLVRALRVRRVAPRVRRVCMALAHGRKHLRACANVARRRRRERRCGRRASRPELPGGIRARRPRADIAQWSGLARVHLDGGLAQLQLRRFVDEHGRELYDLPRAPLPAADTAAPIRFLPRFDNLVLSHDDRRRVISDEHRALVIEGGEVRATFLVDGFVAGIWTLERGPRAARAVRRPPRAVARESSPRRRRGSRPSSRPPAAHRDRMARAGRAAHRARLHAPATRRTPSATIAAAVESGITVFDTARAYEGSEALLANVLRGVAGEPGS